MQSAEIRHKPVYPYDAVNIIKGERVNMMRLEDVSSGDVHLYDYATMGLCSEIVKDTQSITLSVGDDDTYILKFFTASGLAKCSGDSTKTVTLTAGKANQGYKLSFETNGVSSSVVHSILYKVQSLNYHGAVEHTQYDSDDCGQSIASESKPIQKHTEPAFFMLPLNPVGRCAEQYRVDYFIDRDAGRFGWQKAYHHNDNQCLKQSASPTERFANECIESYSGSGFSEIARVVVKPGHEESKAANTAVSPAGLADVICGLAELDPQFTPSWYGARNGCSSGNSGDSSTGSVIGTIILVAVLLIVTLYCAVGLWFRRANGARGLRMIPHFEAFQSSGKDIYSKLAGGTLQTDDEAEESESGFTADDVTMVMMEEAEVGAAGGGGGGGEGETAEEAPQETVDIE